MKNKIFNFSLIFIFISFLTFEHVANAQTNDISNENAIELVEDMTAEKTSSENILIIVNNNNDVYIKQKIDKYMITYIHNSLNIVKTLYRPPIVS